MMKRLAPSSSSSEPPRKTMKDGVICIYCDTSVAQPCQQCREKSAQNEVECPVYTSADYINAGFHWHCTEAQTSIRRRNN